VNLETQKKWNQIYTNDLLIVQDPVPAQVIVDFAHLLPNTGQALDLACGRGANSLFLAARGLECWAWDISDVVIEQLSAKAEKRRLNVRAQVRDIEKQPLPAASYNVIVVTHFLNRSMSRQIIRMLKPNGLLFYQTYTVDALVFGIGPKNPDYLLCQNELGKMFSSLQLHGYREDGLIANSKNNLRGQAYLVARKCD
jgi:2-polyprenyl-3-methyl-5-hydroxy-6-metoxy-1,4-benzoquinol methylase